MRFQAIDQLVCLKLRQTLTVVQLPALPPCHGMPVQEQTEQDHGQRVLVRQTVRKFFSPYNLRRHVCHDAAYAQVGLVRGYIIAVADQCTPVMHVQGDTTIIQVLIAQA